MAMGRAGRIATTALLAALSWAGPASAGSETLTRGAMNLVGTPLDLALSPYTVTSSFVRKYYIKSKGSTLSKIAMTPLMGIVYVASVHGDHRHRRRPALRRRPRERSRRAGGAGLRRGSRHAIYNPCTERTARWSTPARSTSAGTTAKGSSSSREDGRRYGMARSRRSGSTRSGGLRCVRTSSYGPQTRR